MQAPKSKCEWCGRKYIQKTKSQPTRFCDRSCSAQWRMSRPEYVKTLDTEHRRETSRRNMRKMRRRPDVQKKLAKHLASKNNPFRDPRTSAKAQAVLREQGYRHLNGGNGRGASVPQKLLASRLGWPMEHAVSTKPRPPGYPTHYKIDIAEPTLKIAIEVDGWSHLIKSIKVKDAKKDRFLRRRGWKVLRFTNQTVLNKTDKVVDQVLKVVRSST